MTLLLGIGTVVFAGIGMGLHKLADRPVLEVCVWVVTFSLFLGFEVSLHR